MSEEVKLVISADNSRANAALAQTETRIKAVGTATQFTKAQMQQLNFQMTDIATGLATGQSPLTVLLQQGGQLKDTFGGIGGAARALATGVGAMINPFTVAAAAVVGLGAAFVAGKSESDKLAKSLALTGNIAGQTADSYRLTAENVARATEVSIGASKELVSAAIASGAFGPRAIAEVTQAMVRVQKLTGETAEEVLARFKGMSRGVADWAAEANRSYNFLTEAQFKYIFQLEKQEGRERAAVETARLLNEELGARMPKNLGLAERAWDSIGRAASRAWDSFLGIGRSDTLGERIASAQDAVSRTVPGGRIGDASRAQLNTFNRDAIRQSEQASARSTAAIAAQEAIARVQQSSRGGRGGGSAGGRARSFDQMYPAANTSSILSGSTNFARFERPGYDDTEAFLRDQAQKEYDIERERQEKMADLQQDYAIEQSLLREEALQASKTNWELMAESWEDVNARMSDVGRDFQDGFVQGGRDAFGEFLRTGRISMRSFEGIVVESITRLIYDQLIAKQLGQFSQSLFSMLATAFVGYAGGGGGYSYNGGVGTTNAAGISGGRATGGSMQMGRSYMVGEEGPERVWMGSGGAWVQPSYSKASGGGRNVVVNQRISVGDGVNMSQLSSAMVLAKNQAKAEIANSMRRGNRAYLS